MRLIDADELVEALDEALEKRTDPMDALRKQLLVGFAKQILSDAPTIEAIPIEWLEKWLSKKVFVWDATTMKYEKDRLQAIENIKYGFETMLEDWRKENADVQ